MRLSQREKNNLWLFSSETEGITFVEDITKDKVKQMIAERTGKKSVSENDDDNRSLEELAQMMAINDMTQSGVNTTFFKGGKVGCPSQSSGTFSRLGEYVTADGIRVSKGWVSKKCGVEPHMA